MPDGLAQKVIGRGGRVHFIELVLRLDLDAAVLANQ